MFNKVQPTVLDQMIDECNGRITDARSRLKDCVIDVITKTNVVALYPDGPDKEKAKEVANQAQQSLLCAIGQYDSQLVELKRLLGQPNPRLTTSDWEFNLNDSHKIIEEAYRNYFKKKYIL